MDILFALIWLICAIATPAVAASQGRGGCLWILLGFLLGPIALLVVLATAPAQPAEPSAVRIPCPHCAEMILPEANICRFCGNPVKSATTAPTPASIPRQINYRTCLNCKASNPITNVACSECGQPFLSAQVTPTPPIVVADLVKCSGCGANNPSGRKYCVVCSRALPQP